jgi:hypothetical protein
MKQGADFVSMIALFGWGRHTDRLNSEYRPLTFAEIDAEAAAYGRYCEDFDARRPDAVKLDFLVAPSSGFFADHIDRWYERSEGEPIGKYTLYKLNLR